MSGRRLAVRNTAALWLLLALAKFTAAQPLWLDAAGQALPAAREALGWLQQADRDGLRAADYGAERLAQALAHPATPEAAAQLDIELSQAVLRYLGDLRHGRVDPAQLRARYDSITAPAPDLPTLLRETVTQGRPGDALRAATPPWPEYAPLRDALARYRALGEHPAWQQPLPAMPGGKLQPGQAWAGLPRLAERLVLLGDLPAGFVLAEPVPPATGIPTTPAASYDATLQEAVRSFQRRHGLAADGVIGKATLDALAVPPAARAHQIELAMERLRLTPLPAAPRFLTVNVPEFMLRAYEQSGSSVQQAMAMRVIVGKALNTRTPLFDEDMRWIEFSPYWNIPPSIARGETIPRLRANPGYLAAQGMEFVGAGGVSTAVTADNLEAVRAGQMRIRQRPGPRNALGDIKFMLPNNQNIYLHHTPSTGLFNRPRRDFSHGCIRIEEPVALAQWVLHGDPSWTEERIRASMGRPRPVTANLPEPVPVLIIYSTAIVAEGGEIHFVPDLYGHDRLLEQALRRRNEAASTPALAAQPL